jgi:hypothetical protein
MKKLLISVMLMLVSFGMYAQERPINEIHAAFIFNITKYVVWSNEADGKSLFVIGIMGDQDLYKSASQWYNGKNKAGKKIEVKTLKNFDDIYGCDLIYYAGNSGSEFDKIKIAVNGQPILLVTDRIGFGKKGAGVNLPLVDGKITIELNMTTLNAGSFKVSSLLSSIAKIIN